MECSDIIKNYDDTEGNGSYISIERKKVKTIRDMVIEAAKTFNTKTYIKYKVKDEVKTVNFEELLKKCEIYETWLENEMKDHKNPDRGIHVGLLGIGSFTYYIGYLGTMFSGNVTIPMDPNMDLDTLTYCINHGDVDIIFYESKFLAKIDVLKRRCENVKKFILLEISNEENDEEEDDEDIILEEVRKSIDEINVYTLQDILDISKEQKVDKDVKPEDNALIIYTSGTTGKKKGVVLTHDNLIDKFFSTLNFKGNQTEIYLCILPLYHIFSSNDFLFSLRFGFTVCFDFDIPKLVQNLQFYQPTKTSLVPLLAKNLLNTINLNIKNHPEISMEEAKQQIVGKNFYKIQSGGGYLSPELTEGYKKLGILIGQGYGLTETASKATLSDFNYDKAATVGRIAPNSEMRIVNGEIQIKSRAVMKEYYKDPERTREAFTEDGWLRTGDLGHFDKDGYLYLTGRIKNLIILSNGENVSPEAIETMYASEPLIEEMIVYGHEDVLCTEIYPNFKYAEMNGIEKDSIKDAIWKIIKTKNKGVPSYEQINRLSIREQPFVKTPSKKIIRSEFMKELEMREKVKQGQLDDINMPTNDTQKKLYEIVSHALGNKPFGIDSDLYEFGLDSFSCTTIMNEIRREFNKPISLNYVVHNSTIINLEKFINEYKEDDGEESVDLSIRDVYPTNTSQKFSFYAYNGSTQGNIPCLFRLHRDIDLEKLRTSIIKLIDIHYELKATIHLNEEGKYMNYRHDERKADIKITKLTDKEWEEVRKGLAHPYHSIEEELLYHIGIYQTESNNYLYFDVAHLMCDGLSFKNLMDDLTDIYCGKTVEPKTYSFFEFALECAHNGIQTFLNERKYHNNLLNGLTLRGNAFVRRDAYNHKPYEDGRFLGKLQRIDLSKFENFCKENSVTENSVFLVAAAHAINLYQDSKDIAVGSAHNGRTSDRYSRVCGYVTNLYEYRYKEIENETVIDSLHRIGKQIMETMCTRHAFLQRNCMVVQYQGRIHEYKSLCGKPVVQEEVVLDAVFCQLSIYKRENCFKYIMSYWYNIYDTAQLEKFINIMEDVVVGIINGTKYIKDLRSQILEENITTKRLTSVEELNEAIGKKFISCPDEKNSFVNAYILCSELQRQVIGGWGDLYLEENEYIKCKEFIDNPFGEGKLYKTGYTGRFLPDEKKSINILENDCRFIMWEYTGFDRYGCINIVEKSLMEYEGIEKAISEIKFIEDQFFIVSKIYGKKEPDIADVKKYLENKLEKRLIPAEITFYKLE